MTVIVMLLGTLVPIMAASVFYIGDRRVADRQRSGGTWFDTEPVAGHGIESQRRWWD